MPNQMITEEPIYHVNLGNHPEFEPLFTMTVRERQDLILHAAAFQCRRLCEPERQLMALGALSLMATHNQCAVPESLIEDLTWVALEARARESSQPGE
jgi:hypothetical protein